MDRIAAMTAFVRVVEAGTFTKAAETLDLPNATVTRLIQGLEEELKVRLLHRTTRSVTVTLEGAAYYERVVRLLADLADIESSTQLSQGKPSGRVRVETAAAMGSMVIVPALPGFYARYPEVCIELSAGNRLADVVAEGIDCALRAGVIDAQQMVARKIGEFHFTTCATAEFIKTHGAPRTMEELAARPTVGLMSNTGRPFAYRFTQDGAASDVMFNYKLVVNDTNTYVAAALAGLGIIQAPAYAVHEAIKAGRLIPLMEGWQTPAVPVSLLYAPNRYLSTKVRVFIDWVAGLFDEHENLRRS